MVPSLPQRYTFQGIRVSPLLFWTSFFSLIVFRVCLNVKLCVFSNGELEVPQFAILVQPPMPLQGGAQFPSCSLPFCSKFLARLFRVPGGIPFFVCGEVSGNPTPVLYPPTVVFFLYIVWTPFLLCILAPHPPPLSFLSFAFFPLLFWAVEPGQTIPCQLLVQPFNRNDFFLGISSLLVVPSLSSVSRLLLIS